MSKFLLYLDAENVSAEEAQVCVSEIKANLRKDEQLIGKFYGAISELESNLPKYYSLGLEYVETSTILKNHKNVTDMKIVVDCVQDVYENFRGLVGKVCVLSHDCDFVPLYLKLYNENIEVETPLFVHEDDRVTLQDVSKSLPDLKYVPIDTMGTVFCFENLFSFLREKLSFEFEDELIIRFLDKKKKKFLHTVSSVISDGVITEMMEMSALEFSFVSLIDREHFDTTTLQFVVKQYVSKFFGYVYPQKDLEDVVKMLQSL